jgi:hypothetical protein
MTTNPHIKANQERADKGLKAALLSVKLAFNDAKLTNEQKSDILVAAIDIVRLHGALTVVDTLLPDPQKVVRQGGGCEHEIAILEIGADIERRYNQALTRLHNLSSVLMHS